MVDVVLYLGGAVVLFALAIWLFRYERRFKREMAEDERIWQAWKARWMP